MYRGIYAFVVCIRLQVCIFIAWQSLTLYAQDLESLDDIFAKQAQEGQDQLGPEEAEGSAGDKPAGLALSYFLRISLLASVMPTSPEYGSWQQSALESLKGKVSGNIGIEIFDEWFLQVEGSSFFDSAFAINGTDSYSYSYLNDYAMGIALDKLYITGSILPFWSFKLGQDLSSWGGTHYLDVLDELSPFDLSRPGRSSDKSNRLPLVYLQQTLRFWHFSFDGQLILPKVHTLSAWGSPYYEGNREVTNKVPDLFTPDLAASMRFWHGSFDVSVLYAYFHQRLPYAFWPNPMKIREYDLRYQRKHMLGVNMQFSFWQLGLRSEWGFHWGERYASIANTEKAKEFRLVGLAGIDFYIPQMMNSSIISAELRYTSMPNDYDALCEDLPYNPRKAIFSWAIGTKLNFFSETLHLEGLLLSNGWAFRDGGLARFAVRYDFSQMWSGEFNSTLYINGCDGRNEEMLEKSALEFKIILSLDYQANSAR